MKGIDTTRKPRPVFISPSLLQRLLSTHWVHGIYNRNKSARDAARGQGHTEVSDRQDKCHDDQRQSNYPTAPYDIAMPLCLAD